MIPQLAPAPPATPDVLMEEKKGSETSARDDVARLGATRNQHLDGGQ